MTRHNLRGLDLIAARIVVSESGCWLWTGRTNSFGYGLVGGTRAHAFTYRLIVGPVPMGLELDHLCRLPLCANPFHLEPVTADENRRRKYEAQTHCRYGHEFSPENTRLRPGLVLPLRWCRECERRRDRDRASSRVRSRLTPRRSRATGEPRKLRPACPSGHEYTPENTRVNPSGHRVCRACARQHFRNSQARSALWAAANAGEVAS